MPYRTLIRPLLFRLPPEAAHELSLHSLNLLLRSAALRKRAFEHTNGFQFGPLKRFGLRFDNPIGLAAGFDKNGVAVLPLSALGFGFIEVGTITHQGQPGNPKPRIFRLPADRALINRAGFNNEGAAAVCARLRGMGAECVVGVNIGKSRVVPIEDAEADYLASFELAHSVADYVVVNVSSPNTPNLRELQQPDVLRSLLTRLQQRNSQLSDAVGRSQPVPLLVKIAPDLEDADLEAIVAVSISAGVAGIVATNTTISREGLRTDKARVQMVGPGGLSGAPLRAPSTRIIARLFQIAGKGIPIIGVGGIFTAEDAWEKICAGASLLQLYTALIYEGPLVAKRMNEGLSRIFASSGFRTFDDAVGSRAAELATRP
jgi:dihydroorotate dehydrogenase